MRKKEFSKNLCMLLFLLMSLFVFGEKPSTNYYIDSALPKASTLQKSIMQLGKNSTFQLFSHGKPGELLIDGTWRNPQFIAEFLKLEIRNSQYRIENVNIYGCEFGKGTKGKQAVAYLEKTLGVTVAASTNITGKGGDWKLEIGKPNNTIGISNYQGNLQASLELISTSGSTGQQGPTISPQTANFQLNTNNPTGTTFTAPASAISVTASLSNQQFGSGTNSGIEFGGGSYVGSSGTPPGYYLFLPVNDFCSTNIIDSWFTSASLAPASTGLNTGTNYGFEYGLYQKWLVGQPNAGTFYYGDITFTFSSPVTNPVFHIADLGASFYVSGAPSSKYYSQAINLKTSGLTLTQLSGSGLTVTSTGLTKTDQTIYTDCPGTNGASIRVNGTNITTVTFGLSLNSQTSTEPWSNTNAMDGAIWSWSLNACNAGITAPALSGPSISITCPTTTVNLNSLVTSSTPSGSSLVWFTNSTHTGTAYSTPTTATAGTYYAYYYDSVGNCYSPASSAVAVNINSCLDTDGDGIPDYLDVDDDNDGILDTVESCTTSRSLTWTNPSAGIYEYTDAAKDLKIRVTLGNYTEFWDYQNSYNGTVDATCGSYTTSSGTTIPNSNALFLLTGFASGTSTSGTLTVDYYNAAGTTAKNVTNPRIHISGVGGSSYDGTTYRVTSSSWALQGGKTMSKLSGSSDFATTFNSLVHGNLGGGIAPAMSNCATGEVSGTVMLDGVQSSYQFNVTQLNYSGAAANNFVSGDGFTLVFEYDFCNDTDGDGIPNYLDLDSDNDGCVDAIEGGASVLISQLVNAGGIAVVGTGSTASNQNLCGGTTCVSTSGSNIGLPQLTAPYDYSNSSGQTIGASQNASIKSACIDTDGDGVPDDIDVDDDNDGILDINELNCPPVLTSPTISSSGMTYSISNGSNYTSSVTATSTAGLVATTYSALGAYNYYYGEVGVGSLVTNVYTVNTTAGSIPTLRWGIGAGDMTFGQTALPTENGAVSQNFTSVLTWTGGGTAIVNDPDDQLVGLQTGDVITSGTTVKFLNPALTSGLQRPYGAAPFDTHWYIDINTGTNASSTFKLTVALTQNANWGTYDVQTVAVPFSSAAATCTDKDTDGDGIPDRLDLDSDNDGCLDAIEGGANITTAQLVNAGGIAVVGTGSSASNQNLCGGPTCVSTSGSNIGLPQLTSPTDYSNTTGQGIGDSQDSTVKTQCTDTDGIPDNIDVDDDNDGILDTVENTCPGISPIVWNSTTTGTLSNTFTSGSGASSLVGTSVTTATSSSVQGPVYGTGGNNIYVLAKGGAGAITGNSTTVTFPVPVTISSFNVRSIGAANGTATSAPNYDEIQIIEFYNGNTRVYFDGTLFGVGAGTLYKHPYYSGIDATYNATGPYYDKVTGIAYPSNVTTNTGSTVYPGPNALEANYLFNINVPITKIVVKQAPAGKHDNVGFNIYGLCLGYIDTDTDGIPNYLDLDSDNDGCLDAMEGGASITTTQLVSAGGIAVVGTGSTAANQNLCGDATCVSTSGTNIGLPQLTSPTDYSNASGQGAGDSANALVSSQCAPPYCYKPAVTSGTVLDTNHGITAINRAGSNIVKSDTGVQSDNWPMVRKGAWTALESKTKAFVVNRVDFDSSTPYPKPVGIAETNYVEGMMVYDKTNHCLKIYDGTNWRCYETQACPN